MNTEQFKILTYASTIQNLGPKKLVQEIVLQMTAPCSTFKQETLRCHDTDNTSWYSIPCKTHPRCGTLSQACAADMLSRSERRFVDDPSQFSSAQRRLHRCRINKKIRKFSSDLKAITEKNAVLGLDLATLKSEIEKIPDPPSPDDIKNDKKASSDMQTFSNPYSDANSDW